MYCLLQPGMILNGFIKKCVPYGCFVEFVNNLVALAPNKVCMLVTMVLLRIMWCGLHSIWRMSLYLMAVLYTRKVRVWGERFVKYNLQCFRSEYLCLAGNGIGSREAEISCYPSLLWSTIIQRIFIFWLVEITTVWVWILPKWAGNGLTKPSKYCLKH